MTAHALAMAPTSLGEGKQLAVMLASSALIPEPLRGKPGDVMVVLLTGQEMGLAPMQALRGIAVVKGRPVLSAELLVALVQRSPACEYFTFTTSTADECTFKTLRRGHPEPVSLTWTMADATRAGLANNPTYKAHPAAMLRARCSAALVRAVYPDLALGFLVAEEAEEVHHRERPKTDPERVIDIAPDSAPVDVAQESLLQDGRMALQEGAWDLATEIGARLTGEAKEAFRVEYQKARGPTKGTAGVKAALAKKQAPVEREPGSDDDEVV